MWFSSPVLTAYVAKRFRTLRDVMSYSYLCCGKPLTKCTEEINSKYHSHVCTEVSQNLLWRVFKRYWIKAKTKNKTKEIQRKMTKEKYWKKFKYFSPKTKQKTSNKSNKNCAIQPKNFVTVKIQCQCKFWENTGEFFYSTLTQVAVIVSNNVNR